MDFICLEACIFGADFSAKGRGPITEVHCSCQKRSSSASISAFARYCLAPLAEAPKQRALQVKIHRILTILFTILPLATRYKMLNVHEISQVHITTVKCLPTRHGQPCRVSSSIAAVISSSAQRRTGGEPRTLRSGERRIQNQAESVEHNCN